LKTDFSITVVRNEGTTAAPRITSKTLPLELRGAPDDPDERFRAAYAAAAKVHESDPAIFATSLEGADRRWCGFGPRWSAVSENVRG